jgi:hypothetical protein
MSLSDAEGALKGWCALPSNVGKGRPLLTAVNGVAWAAAGRTAVVGATAAGALANRLSGEGEGAWATSGDASVGEVAGVRVKAAAAEKCTAGDAMVWVATGAGATLTISGG